MKWIILLVSVCTLLLAGLVTSALGNPCGSCPHGEFCLTSIISSSCEPLNYLEGKVVLDFSVTTTDRDSYQFTGIVKNHLRNELDLLAFNVYPTDGGNPNKIDISNPANCTYDQSNGEVYIPINGGIFHYEEYQFGFIANVNVTLALSVLAVS
ncbi:hypothetical protein SAMD00019534_088600 [Acytostelium subglobosum LB1]|uniref:hypothetical protein n=1 Tax=Acytostelium subglobosum LB1 TaxID=1410327 RepID=UPI00064510C1|nr:hypothetical protein SAMD00019534_088600 [Acytostelium subglobosum LB1]GAM25685.1 hypothetical protein SAMD00019534_088600 [Acytostelium subglobosum LB1]|eukprot:XP_012751203.1 hypothetical protein SAMD00019534_088600 [Acytostelium subglobosum LB1]